LFPAGEQIGKGRVGHTLESEAVDDPIAEQKRILCLAIEELAVIADG
jgi:hypothetical protein